ncbi:MAG: VOC family protein [Nocardioidaceae bacterium]
MHLDHLSYAAAPQGLVETTARLGGQLGEEFCDGGVHPRFGTRNMVLPLADGRYVEVVTVLDHPASDKMPFGQAVRARSLAGGGWLGWVVAVEDIATVEDRLGRTAIQGNRYRPDGVDLRWKQVGILGSPDFQQPPFAVQWEVAPEQHPSAAATGQVRLEAVEIAGDPALLVEWLGEPAVAALEAVSVQWVAPHAAAALVAAHFSTPHGHVRLI